MSDFELSVVIPHFNDPVGLSACLASLQKQHFDMQKVEIIICDNNSDFPPTGLEAFDLNLKLVVETKRGAGPARNAGVAEARGEYIAFTDCDCLLDPDFVKTGLAHMTQNGERSVLAGKIAYYPKNAHPNYVESFDIIYAMDQESHAVKGDAATGNLWTSRALFNEVGPFVADIAEDTDWCRRAFAAGATFQFGDDCIVNHPARATLEELRAKWRRQSAMTFNVWKKKPLFSIKWPALCAATALSAIPHSLKALRSDKFPFLSDRLKSILVLFWCRLFRAKIMTGFYLSGQEKIDPNKYWTNA
ncbi:glycosyltransferase [uncultured Sneathiella sp.]|uniref:glycosyltransferase n=1 Tax=uncultured Sneathiella sp. TaxID=879315 RepID=UPI0030EC21D4|tara:strand:- start:26352 stop:27260 length:909 start_codon:yes stop_codon:yes gene_type:complete